MLRTQLNDALKQALKTKDQLALSTVRLILAALKDRDIQARGEGRSDCVSDQEILELLQKMIKQRRDSIELYKEGNRLDLAEREAGEIEVIERFMPQPLDEEETAAAVSDAVEETGATGMRDMGRAMAFLKQRFAGRMDFAKASVMLKQKLT